MTADTFPLAATSDGPTCAHGPLSAFECLDPVDRPASDPARRALNSWVREYLMRPHPALGRTGHVCPFTAQSNRLNLLRLAVSPARGDDKDEIMRTMRMALAVFDGLPCTRSNRIFRTVIVGFPACADAEGRATLRQVQNALRHHSIVHAKMIGLFEPESQAEGLLNPAFRPLRSPIPALAIRMLVEQDAPFVVRNPLLVPVYLAKFPMSGLSRLIKSGLVSHVRKRLLSRWHHAPTPSPLEP